MDDRSRDGTATEACENAVHTVDEEDIVQSLSGPGGVADSELLQNVKARIRRALDDPRPSLSLDQVDAVIDALVAKARADSGRA